MNIQVIHSLPERLRLRYDKGALTDKQVILVKVLLSSQEGISSISINTITRSILIYYTDISKEQVIAYFKALNDNYLNDPELLSAVEDISHDNTSILTSLFIMTAKHLLKRFLPIPIKRAVTMINTVPRIINGVSSLFQERKLSSETLDATAISLSLARGDYNTAGSINFLLNMGETLEDYAKRKSYNNLAETLFNINEKATLLLDNGDEQSISAYGLKINDKVIVRTGHLIPADGVIIQGEGLINQSSITGEPLALMKEIDDIVYAGTLLEEGEIVVNVTAAGQDTKVSKIVKLIDDSNSFKALAQEKAEQLADKLVPYNFLLAGLTYLFTGDIIKTSSTLMVDYSCAMKLSAPIATLSAMKEAANKGVVIKGGRYLEELALADTIIFDKTGTLTEATPKVKSIIPFNDYTYEEVLKTAACLEEHFPHPLARAVVQEAYNQGIDHKEEHAKVEYIVAHGIASTLHGEKVAIGSYHFIFEDEKVELQDKEKIEIDKLTSFGYSVLYLSINKKLMGIIAIEDPVRHNAKDMINFLKDDGVENLVMITGDGEKTATKVAETLGIDKFKYQALPEDKTEYVQKMKDMGYRVAMTGDGINDSPALAAAQVGIAMKGSSDIASETADIVLSDKGLESLVETRLLGKALLKRINDNNKIIIGGNSFFILAGLMGFMAPASAAFLHNALTVGISANAMRNMVKEKK